MSQLSPLIKSNITQVTDVIRKNPIVSGAVLGGSVLGASQVVRIIRKRRKKSVGRRKRRKVTRRKTRSKTKRKRRIASWGKVRKAHKGRIRGGLDIIHKRGRKGISLKTIRAAIKSPRTPAHLKKGLRKLLRKKARHTHVRR